MENPQKPRKLLGKNNFKYKQQYGVIIICDDELAQKETYERLSQLGYKPKVVCV